MDRILNCPILRLHPLSCTSRAVEDSRCSCLGQVLMVEIGPRATGGFFLKIYRFL